MDEIKAKIERSSKPFTDQDKLILKIPIIQWQLGWYYGSIFSYNWLSEENRLITSDNDLNDFLYSWPLFNKRLQEFYDYFQNEIMNKDIKDIEEEIYEEINIQPFFQVKSTTKCYPLNDLKESIENGDLILHSVISASNGDISNFSTTSITLADNWDNINKYVGAFGSLSIQHRFEGEIIKLENDYAEIEISGIKIHINDGFDFINNKEEEEVENQPLGYWKSDIYDYVKPTIYPAIGRIKITNEEYNIFKINHGIGLDFRIIFKIDENNLTINKIIYDRINNTIRYE